MSINNSDPFVSFRPASLFFVSESAPRLRQTESSTPVSARLRSGHVAFSPSGWVVVTCDSLVVSALLASEDLLHDHGVLLLSLSSK